ncbi:hypothetical protein ACWD7Y_05255 [Streptomyces drozdowiczii]
MAELTTEKVTTHTLTLTDEELASLRLAASTALNGSVPSPHDCHWREFARLGMPATRTDTTRNGLAVR